MSRSKPLNGKSARRGPFMLRLLVLDVSQCPFFTGQDALEFSISVQPRAEGTQPPPPIATKPPPTEFTWAKGKHGDDWVVRGPVGHANQEVTVTARSGAKRKQLLGKAVWTNEAEGVSLYQKGGR